MFFPDFWCFFRSIREIFENSPNLRPALHTPGLPLLYALRSPTTSRLPSHLPPQICHLSQSCIQIYHIVNINWVVYKGILYLKKLLKRVVFLSVLLGHSVFSSPPQQPMTSDFEGFSIPDFIHNIYFPILILEKEPVFPFRMFSAEQGNYWYHFYTVFGMTRALTRDWTRDLPHSRLGVVILILIEWTKLI